MTDLRERLAALAVIAAAAPTEANASGFAVEHQNARALGAAYAGAQARAADAGFAVYNPAAIAGVERLEISSNASGLWGESQYRGASGHLLGSVPVSGVAADDGVLPPAFVPSLAIASPLTERLTIGLAVASPFGLKSRFARESIVRYHAQEASLLTVAVSPTLAYEISSRLSIGASFKIEYMDFSASTAVDAGGLAFLNSVPGFAPGSSDLFAQFDGSDVAVGFTAGLQARIAPFVRLGFSYASKVVHDFDGEASFDLAASPAAQILNAASGVFAPSEFSSSLTMPASYSVGVEMKATDRLKLLASVSLMRWSSFDELTIAFANPAQPAEVFTSGWSDSWSASVGADFAVSTATTLRAGVMFDETPVNDAFASPRIPDADRFWLAAGVTHEFSDSFSVDLGAGVLFADDRPISQDGAVPENFLRGSLAVDIATDTYALAARLRRRF